MKSLILAAGYATRLYPLTENFPKPLLDVGGRPIVQWLLEDIDAIEAIDGHVIVTNHRFYEHFAAWADKAPLRKPVTVIDDRTMDNDGRLGAVLDIRLAVAQAGPQDDWLVLAGDNVLDFSLAGFVSFFLEKQAPCILCYREPDPARQRRTGIITLDAGGRVTSFAEKPERPASELAVPPFYAYRAQDVARIGEALADGCGRDAPGSLAAWLAGQGDVYAWPMPGARYDIGNLQSYEAVRDRYHGPAL